MDNIVKAKINYFKEKFGFYNESQTNIFEHLVSYSILSTEISDNITKIDLETISTEEARGIDSILVSINNKIIKDSSEVANFKGQSVKVNFYFLQSKTSPHFEDGDIGIFLDTVVDRFKDKDKMNYTHKKFENFESIFLEIINTFNTKIEYNIFCYFVTLGTEQNDKAIVNEKTQNFSNLGLFHNIKIELIGRNLLLQKFNKIINPLEATFRFENKLHFKAIQNVEQAFIGFIPFSEFRNLIVDDNNKKISSLFNDNIRDFLGFENNNVNNSIKNTLEQKKFDEFSLLNNGITIIADKMDVVMDKITLTNYQIINGCQTSNVLYECKDINGIDDVSIPIKIIVTEDDELKNLITVSTNSQTSVAEEQLICLTNFPKELEEFYRSEQDGIFYERRPNQYFDINRTEIIDIKEQIKSFISMFFDVPYLVAGYFGRIVKDYKENLFNKDHNKGYYYISGLISNKWDKLAKNKDFDKEHKEFNKFRYHIFWGFRFLVEKKEFHKEFLKDYKKYSITEDNKKTFIIDLLLANIRDDNKFITNIKKVISALRRTEYNRAKGAYSSPIYNDFKEELKKEKYEQ